MEHFEKAKAFEDPLYLKINFLKSKISSNLSSEQKQRSLFADKRFRSEDFAHFGHQVGIKTFFFSHYFLFHAV